MCLFQLGGMQHLLSHPPLDPLPVNIHHRKELPYLGLSPTASVSTALASLQQYLPPVGPSKSEKVGVWTPVLQSVTCIFKQYLHIGAARWQPPGWGPQR